MPMRRHVMTGLILLGIAHENGFGASRHDSDTFEIRHAWSVPTDGASDDERRFGASGVLVHEDVLAIATDRGSDGSLRPGKVRLYSRDRPDASPTIVLTAPERTWPDGFGSVLAGRDRHLLIGAPQDSETNWGAGRAWLYVMTDTGWAIEHAFADPSAETDAAFGHAVAIGEGVIAIGAPRSDRAGRDAGCVFIFERTDHDWALTARLVAPDAAPSDFFGSSLAISGDHLVIGAWGDDDHGEKTGSVWCYEKRSDRWSMRQKLVPDRIQSRDLFGSTLLLHGHELLVSAPGTREDRGAVYVFTGRTGRWELIDRITDPDGDQGDRFGHAMAGSGDILVIGAPEAGAGTSAHGRITIHRKSGWGWSLIDRHSIVSRGNRPPIRFGFNVSIEADAILVGRADQADETPAAIGAWLFDQGATITKDKTNGTAISPR